MLINLKELLIYNDALIKYNKLLDKKKCDTDIFIKTHITLNIYKTHGDFVNKEEPLLKRIVAETSDIDTIFIISKFLKILIKSDFVNRRTDLGFLNKFAINADKNMLLFGSNFYFSEESLFRLFVGYYNIFFNAGLAGASFLAISVESLILDCNAINYAMLKNIGDSDLCENLITNCSSTPADILDDIEILESVDFILILDYNLKKKYFRKLLDTNCFIVGTSAHKDGCMFFDSMLPIEEATEEVQYFFLEFALFSYMRGSRYKSKLTLVKKYDIINTMLK